MSPRFAYLITASVLAGLVLLRAFPFVWWPGAHFDSDQAIVRVDGRTSAGWRRFRSSTRQNYCSRSKPGRPRR
jgi:hypothetical protein